MKKRHKILFVFGAGTWSGTATGLRGILRSIDRERYDPHLAIVSPEESYLHFFKAADLPIHRIPVKGSVERLTNLIRQEKIPLVQSCSGASAGACAAQATGIPHVWFVGGPLDQTGSAEEAWSPAPSRHSVKMLSHLIDLLSDAIVVPCALLASTTFPGVSPTKLHVIPFGIDVDRFKPASALAKPLRQRPRVAMVANFFPLKRHSDFLQAAHLIHQQHPQASFVIAGRCSMRPTTLRRVSIQYRERVFQQISALGLGRRLTVSPFDPNQADVFFSSIDVLLSPSIEAFGQAVGEAMAMGKPVIAVNKGGTGEIIQDGKSGLLVPFGNPRALAAAVLKVLRDKTLAARLGQESRRRIFKKFTAARQTGRFQQLYDRLLADKSCRSSSSAFLVARFSAARHAGRLEKLYRQVTRAR